MKPWALWLLRIAVTVEAVAIFNQAVFAGQFLAGDFGALGVHRANADAAGAGSLLQLIAAVLLWRPGRGPAWPIAACTALFLLVGAQIGLGFERILAVHVPLGVALTIGTVLLLVWVWRPRRAAALDQSTVDEPDRVPA